MLGQVYDGSTLPSRGRQGKLYLHLEGGREEGGREAGRALRKQHVCRLADLRERLLFGT